MNEIFIQAINEMKIVDLTFKSYEKGIIKRRCIPFDFGPSRKYKDGLDRYHFYDLDSPDANHNLSILPNQVINISLTETIFNPGDFITWKTNWFVKRDWGQFS